MRRTADSIEETKAAQGAENTEPISKKRGRGNPEKIAPFKWPKGVSGNPGGRPKSDIAAQLARLIIESNKEGAYKGLSKALAKGNAYVFKELAERGYGKLKESKEVTHIHQETPDAELSERIAALERDLGLAREIDAAGRIGISEARAVKANGHAKDTDVLS